MLPSPLSERESCHRDTERIGYDSDPASPTRDIAQVIIQVGVHFQPYNISIASTI